MAEVVDDGQAISRFQRAPSPRVIRLSAGLIAVLIAVVIAVMLANRPPTGDAGRLSEPTTELPSDIALPVLFEATNEWGLDDLGLVPAADAMAGGVAVADIDGTGHPELIIANGDVAVLSWTGDGYGNPIMLDVVDAIGVTATDVDRDGLVDVLVATASDVDHVFWGGSWVGDGSKPESVDLPADGQSSGLLAAELSGDGDIDIVRLGRGRVEPAPDLLWIGNGRREFRVTELPLPDRFTLAGEILDADSDGLLDIWLTRDVGWARGGDTVLSRQGDATGDWVDVAADLGVALEVDGMGITVADLNGDAELDAYVSDLGDNEQLLRAGDRFVSAFDTGAAHIRPMGAPDDVVSSTWGTGALDINLDGRLDLVLGSGGFPVGAVRNKIDGTQVAVAEPPAVLLGTGNGMFVDVWAQLGIEQDVVARGLAVADLDRDGDDDVLIVDRRGGVVALRNDTIGPTITVYLGPTCGYSAGRVVTVTTAAGTYQRLLAPHGYASSHAAEIIVGNPGTRLVDFTVTGAFSTEVERAPRAFSGRQLWSLEC